MEQDNRPWYKKFFYDFVLSIPKPNTPPSKLARFTNKYLAFGWSAMCIYFLFVGIVLLTSGEPASGLFAIIVAISGLIWIKRRIKKANR